MEHLTEQHEIHTIHNRYIEHASDLQDRREKTFNTAFDMLDCAKQNELEAQDAATLLRCFGNDSLEDMLPESEKIGTWLSKLHLRTRGAPAAEGEAEAAAFSGSSSNSETKSTHPNRDSFFGHGPMWSRDELRSLCLLDPLDEGGHSHWERVREAFQVFDSEGQGTIKVDMQVFDSGKKKGKEKENSLQYVVQRIALGPPVQLLSSANVDKNGAFLYKDEINRIIKEASTRK